MTQGSGYKNSYADGYMRGKVIEEVGTLLDHMVNEDITTPKLIKMEFGFTYDTIRDLRKKKSSISFETIRKFCYAIGYYLSKEIQAVEGYKKDVTTRESRLKMLYEMKETYKKIYGMQAAVVLNLIHKEKDISAIVLQG